MKTEFAPISKLKPHPRNYDFVWPGDDVAKRWKNAVARIGNSVPPLFMRAIASHIAREILGR